MSEKSWLQALSKILELRNIITEDEYKEIAKAIEKKE